MKVERCDLCGKDIVDHCNPEKNYPKVSYGVILKLSDNWTFYDFCPDCSKKIRNVVHQYINEHKKSQSESVETKENISNGTRLSKFIKHNILHIN